MTATEGEVESLSLLTVKGWAIAYLRLSLPDFGLLHLPEFWAAMDAYWEQKNQDRQHLGELVRGACLRLWNLQVPREHQQTDPAKFWRMPWDPDSDAEIKAINASTDEERDRMAAEFIKRINHGK